MRRYDIGVNVVNPDAVLAGSRIWNESNWRAAQEYVKKLNREKFAGYDDWRLPTLEEAMSLMAPKKMKGDLYIDPVFDKKQRWIWTADKESAGRAWSVSFDYGYCYQPDIGNSYHVRAVRS